MRRSTTTSRRSTTSSTSLGEDCVGIGTDFTQGYEQNFFDWITRDKGRHRRLTEFGPSASIPKDIRTLGELPNLTAAMHARRAGREARVRKVIGGNWLRVFKDVWGSAERKPR